MTRVEEIKEKIRKIDENAFCFPTITDRILMDISVSLAIIADSVSKEDSEQIDNIKDMTVMIRKGATNGEVMETVFPKAKVDKYIDRSCYSIHIDNETNFRKKWWDAPYKGGVE